ncbi:MAG: phosphoglucosamine mutase, partial [Gemmiger sp.]
MLESTLAAGLCSVGADVDLLGVIPTPGVAYLVRKYGADAGIMISASHNPMEFNGIKIFKGDGYKLPDDVENQIEEHVFNNCANIKLVDGAGIGRIRHCETAVDDYVDFLKEHIDADLTGLKVLFDCANGASAATAQKLFPRLGCECGFIGTEQDGLTVNDGCGSTHLETLEAAVRAGGYDCGIAFDGDADRCLACDEQGAEIDGDKIIALVGADMKERGRLDGNTVVVTVMSNLGFMKYMQKLGIETARTAVGDRYVLEEMRAHGYAIGGEQSGHVIFLHHSTTGDGELTAGKLLKMLARKKREAGTRMSELNAVYTKFPQVLINLSANKEQKAAYKDDEYIAGFIESQQQNLMGMGRVLVRVSGTEPKIRVMVEGEDLAAITNSAERISEMIRTRIPGVK